MANIFPIDFEEKLTMAQDDYILFSDSEDGNKIKKAQYKNLKWEPWTPWTPWQDWQDWAAATITVWTTTTWAAGTSASVTNSWTSSAAVFNFTIPQGAKWETWADGKDGKDWVDWKDWTDWTSATITVGTTTTLPAWSSATVTNSWTASAAVLDFGIPKWDTGTGDVTWPASSTDWNLAVFDGATWKIIKDWWAIPTWVPSGWTDGQVLSKVSWNIAWANPSWWDVVVSTDTGNELNTGVGLWLGTETDFSSISTPDTNTLYIQYKSDWGGGWQPWVNTIAYYELNWDATDSTGNYDGTASNVTYTTLASWIDVATFNGSNSKISIASPLVNSLSTFTVNVWVNDTANNFGNPLNNQSSDTNWMFMDSIDWTQFRVWLGWGSNSNSSLTLNTWHNVVLVYNNGTYTVYFDNQQVHTETFTYRNWTNMTLWCRSQAQDRFWAGYISKVIFENKARIVQEIADYYDQTKWDYWIS